jgi:hypothetical protein
MIKSFFGKRWITKQRQKQKDGRRSSFIDRSKRMVIETLEERRVMTVAPALDVPDWNDSAIYGPDLSGKELAMRSVGMDLTYMFHDHQQAVRDDFEIDYSIRNPMLRTVGDRVIIDVVASGDTEQLRQDLTNLGMQVTGSWEQMVSGWLPIEKIGELAELEGVVSARPFMAEAAIGTATSQGDAAQLSNQLNGTGVTVGVLSDSFNNLGGALADVTAGDLPGSSNPNGFSLPVYLLGDLPSGGTDEGRAMLQIVHDVAPSASLAFGTAALGQAAFAQSILDMRTTAGADIIVDDVLYFAEPFFQDGIISQAIDAVTATGATYVSAAGNNASNSYESPFRAGTTYSSGAFASVTGAPAFAGGIAHDFDASAAHR